MAECLNKTIYKFDGDDARIKGDEENSPLRFWFITCVIFIRSDNFKMYCKVSSVNTYGASISPK